MQSLSRSQKTFLQASFWTFSHKKFHQNCVFMFSVNKNRLFSHLQPAAQIRDHIQTMKLKFCQPQTHVIGPIVILSLIDNLRLELVSLNLKINKHTVPHFTIIHQTSFFLFATAWCFYRRSAFRFLNCFYSNTHNTTHILPHHLQKPQKNFKILKIHKKSHIVSKHHRKMFP